MENPTLWQSRPVFLSSTFLDLHADRDYLRVHVFSRLRDQLRERRHHLEPIDLRMGVETGSEADATAREFKVLKVCLEEIRRSRPFFVGLLGDRYGWVPPEERIRAAARAAGFDREVPAGSVTELEILFGVLENQAQRSRSWFYLRELDYSNMPDDVRCRYDERAIANNPLASEQDRREALSRSTRLERLKAWLKAEMPDRVRTYRARWDAECHAVVGLEELADMVQRDLWGDLDGETREYLRDAPRTPDEADARALGDFVEDCTRVLVDRPSVTRRVIEHALGDTGEQWGLCVTSEGGGGKSTLFSTVFKHLTARDDVWVLANAAGISVGSGQVDRLLRRWVYELSAHLGIEDPFQDIDVGEEALSTSGFGQNQRKPISDRIEQIWASLLHRASLERRVVVLVDALDQLESTPRALHSTWIPGTWPANARLIVTAVPGRTTEALLHRDGIVQMALPALGEEEARELATESSLQRYRHELNPRTLEVLLSLQPDKKERPAYANPLWLSLAVDELNLLESDDFEEAERQFGALPAHLRMEALLTGVAQKMPPDVSGAYQRLVTRAQDYSDAAWVTVVVNLIAVSRSGWREWDLRALVPFVSGLAWSDLAFAGLRHALGVHLAERGSQAQWDFFHAQLREAVVRWNLSDRNLLHGRIVDYLLTLPADDPLRSSETMHHLIEFADHGRTARYMAGLAPNSQEMVGAASTLANAIASSQLAGEDVRSWLLGCLEPVSLDDLGLAAEFLLFEVDDNLAFSAVAEVDRGRALEAVHEVLQKRTSGEVPLRCIRLLSVARNKLGDYSLSAGGTGAIDRALQFYQDSRAVAEFLHEEDPASLEAASDLAVVLGKLGDLHHLRRRNRVLALDCYLKAHELSTMLVARRPDDAEFARTLAQSLDHLGQVYLERGETGDEDLALACFQQFHDIAVRIQRQNPHDPDAARSARLALFRLGTVELRRGSLGTLISRQVQTHEIAERVQRENPDSALAARDLALECGSLAELLVRRGTPADVARAAQLYRQAHDLAERMHRRTPQDRNTTKLLAIALHHLAGFSLRCGNLADAVAYRENSCAIVRPLWEQDREDKSAAHDLCVALNSLGELYHRRRTSGDPQRALACWKQSHEIACELHRQDSSDATAMGDVCNSSEHMGDFYMARDVGREDVETAIELYRTSCGIRRRLLERNPDGAVVVRELILACLRVSDAYVRRGGEDDVREVERYRMESLGLARRQHARAPDDTRTAGDLCLCLNRLGDTFGDQRGLALYREWLEIAQGILGREPDNVEAARNVCVAEIRVGNALGEHQAGAEKPHLRGALSILEALERNGHELLEPDRRALTWLREVVAEEADRTNLDGASVLDEVHAEQARADFLPGLCLEEKVSVSTLPLFLYDLIVRERSGEPVPHVVPGEFGVALSILRQLELRDLERLRSSVQAENEGEAAAASADNEQALRCFKTAITANPYNDVALMSYGCLLANIGHHQKGIPWVEEAVRINPANENAARNLRAMRRGP